MKQKHTCIFPNCGKPQEGYELCPNHYMQWYRQYKGLTVAQYVAAEQERRNQRTAMIEDMRQARKAGISASVLAQKYNLSVNRVHHLWR